jgi:hypothetical protein
MKPTLKNVEYKPYRGYLCVPLFAGTRTRILRSEKDLTQILLAKRAYYVFSTFLGQVPEKVDRSASGLVMLRTAPTVGSLLTVYPSGRKKVWENWWRRLTDWIWLPPR